MTPDESIARATTVWPVGGVVYSQVRDHPTDGYRQDCSGFVSMCWDLGAPGLTTVTLVTTGTMVEIPWTGLRPGDAIGHCGPHTGGNDGHVTLVAAVMAGSVRVWEQRGGGIPGPTARILTKAQADSLGYKAYRNTRMTIPEDEDMRMIVDPSTSVYLLTGQADPVTGWPVLVPISNVARMNAYRAAGIPLVSQPTNVDWTFYTRGPLPSAAGLPDHTHVPGGVA